MPDIKIFVSHRIDINSELSITPFIIPIRCRAVFDSKTPMGIAGFVAGVYRVYPFPRPELQKYDEMIQK